MMTESDAKTKWCPLARQMVTASVDGSTGPIAVAAAARKGCVVRSLPEWIGRDADDPVPPRVRVRVFDRKQGRCHRCTRKIMAGEEWTCEHVKALCNGGENREANLDLTCCNCLPEKNAEDVAEKSKTYSIRAKHLGVEKKKYRWWRGRA